MQSVLSADYLDEFEKLLVDLNSWEIQTVKHFKKRLLYCFENLKNFVTEKETIIKINETKNYSKILLDEFKDDDLVIDLGVEAKW